jgi:hypothetical protein
LREKTIGVGKVQIGLGGLFGELNEFHLGQPI